VDELTALPEEFNKSSIVVCVDPELLWDEPLPSNDCRRVSVASFDGEDDEDGLDVLNS
jgi:hypothetical protein